MNILLLLNYYINVKLQAGLPRTRNYIQNCYPYKL